jgi:quinol monooxygenase YgiN
MDRAFAFYRLTHGPAGAQAVHEALRSASGSCAERGCRSSRIWESKETGDLMLMEEWDRQEDFERHVRSAVFRRLLAVLELSESAPEVFFVRGSRLQGMEWIAEILGRETR